MSLQGYAITPLIPLDGLKHGLTGCPSVSTFRGCGQKVHSAENSEHLGRHIPWLTPRLRMLGEVGEQSGERGELGTSMGKNYM